MKPKLIKTTLTGVDLSDIVGILSIHIEDKKKRINSLSAIPSDTTLRDLLINNLKEDIVRTEGLQSKLRRMY